MSFLTILTKKFLEVALRKIFLEWGHISRLNIVSIVKNWFKTFQMVDRFAFFWRHFRQKTNFNSKFMVQMCLLRSSLQLLNNTSALIWIIWKLLMVGRNLKDLNVHCACVCARARVYAYLCKYEREVVRYRSFAPKNLYTCREQSFLLSKF